MLVTNLPLPITLSAKGFRKWNCMDAQYGNKTTTTTTTTKIVIGGSSTILPSGNITVA